MAIIIQSNTNLVTISVHSQFHKLSLFLKRDVNLVILKLNHDQHCNKYFNTWGKKNVDQAVKTHEYMSQIAKSLQSLY